MGIFEKEIKPLLSSSSSGATMSGTIKILSPPTVKNGAGSPGVSVRGGGKDGSKLQLFHALYSLMLYQCIQMVVEIRPENPARTF